MSKDWKCPFCGSDKLMVPTGFVKGVGAGNDFEEEMSYCCAAQKANAKHLKSYDPDSRPDIDDVSKW